MAMSDLAVRRTLRASFRNIVRFSGPWSLRFRARSSSKPTSSTQSRQFSMRQCARMAAAKAVASSAAEDRQKRRSVEDLSCRVTVHATMPSMARPGSGASSGWRRSVGRIGESAPDLGVLRRAVGFQREQPVRPAILDQRRGFAVAMQPIADDRHTVQIEQAEQSAHGGDLAFLIARRNLADRHPRVGREGGHDMQGRLAGGAVEGPAHGLAIDRDNPPAVPAEGTEKARKTGGEGGPPPCQ